MTDLRAWIKFLIGDREAILRIAQDRGAIWIGLLFVLSAGFAREYDGEDLLREPWHLLIPFAASLVVSFTLFAPLWFRIERTQRPPLARGYRAFLTLFWMTAPMAWLYAIPYERLLDAGGSVTANLWTLALVSAWRVLLISRVLAVIMNRRWDVTFVVVLTVADAAVQIVLSFVPLPLVHIMGGVRLSQSDQIIAQTTFMLRVFGTLGLFVLVPTTLLIMLIWSRGGWAVPAAAPQVVRVRGPMLYLAVASLLVWAGILPLTQPEQQRRRAVERELYAGRIESAIEMMSAHPRDGFPPHWDPPPRVGYATEHPPLLDVMEVLADGRGSDWVRSAYVDKFERVHFGHFAYFDPQADRWAQVNAVLERLPERREVRARNADAIERIEKVLVYEAAAATQQSAAVK